MKLNQIKELHLDMTIDSSETIMFNQGGRMSLDLREALGDEELHTEDYHRVTISFQLSKDHQSRFDFIKGAAEEHRQRCYQEGSEPKIGSKEEI